MLMALKYSRGMSSSQNQKYRKEIQNFRYFSINGKLIKNKSVLDIKKTEEEN